MSASPDSLPDSEEAGKLYQRLAGGDPTASADLAVAYLGPLIRWLSEHNRSIDPDLREQAAGEAILALIRNPASYRPELQSLEAYLRMSAQGDLKNLLRTERKHQERRSTWKSVELSPDAGKYLGREDDPSLPLQFAEEQQQALQSLPPSVRAGLTEAESRVFDLLLRKERKTAAYAEAYGVTHLSPKEQKGEVKRVKDRLKQRLKRAGGTDEPAT